MKYSFLNYSSVCFLGFLFLLSPLAVYALSITVSPARQGVVVARGTTQRVFFTVTNTGDTSATFAPLVEAFTINPETGRAVFGAREEAVSWLRAFPESLEIKPKRKGTFFFDISVPQNTEVRSRYLALFAVQKPPADQVAIGSRVGSLLFLHIQGAVTEQLTEVVFLSDKKIALTPRATIALVLKNVGTIHSVPRGSVVATQKGTVLKEFPLNPTNKKVLPQGLWQSHYQLNNLGLHDIGKLDASAIVQYGPDNQQFISRTTVWYIPWQIAVGVAIIVFIIFIAVRTAHRRRRHVEL